MKPRPKALIIDDERATRRLVRGALEKENYKVFEAADGQSGSRAAVNRWPDVVILGLELPDVNGAAWLEAFREWSQIPVLVLSARELVTENVAALDHGANACLVKPFDTAELLARLRVLQRCWPGVAEGSFLIEEDLQTNPDVHEVEAARPLKFTATEQALLSLLVQHAGKVVTCGHLLRSVWGNGSNNKLHELQVLIARVRKKLEAGGNRVLVRTVGRLGYQLFYPGALLTGDLLTGISQGIERG